MAQEGEACGGKVLKEPRIIKLSSCPGATDGDTSSLQSTSGAKSPPAIPSGVRPEIPARRPPLDHRACTKPYRTTPHLLLSSRLIGAPVGLDETRPSKNSSASAACPSLRILFVHRCRDCHQKEVESEDLPWTTWQ